MTLTRHTPRAAGDVAFDVEHDFGMHLILDLEGCDPAIIDSGEQLARFAAELVDRIGMKTYGPLVLEHFGHGSPRTAGFTLFQMIETSSVLGHFVPARGQAHLDVFSCLEFDAAEAVRFCVAYLRAKRGHDLILRR